MILFGIAYFTIAINSTSKTNVDPGGIGPEGLFP